MISASKISAQNNQNLKHINNPVILTDENTKYPLGLHLEIFEAQTRELTIEDVVEREFTPSNKNLPNLGVKTSAIWVRFRVKNKSSLTQKWILSLNDTRAGTVDFYFPQADKKGFNIIKTGRFLPFSTREFNHRFFVFSLPFTDNNEKTIYLRLTSKAGLVIPLNIYSLETFLQEDKNNILSLGIAYGTFIIMIGYNLFLFISLKDKIYLHFVLFIIGYLWFRLCRDGIGHQLLWNNFPNYYEIQSLALLLMLFSWIKFTQSFLKTKKYLPTIDRFLFIISLVIVVAIIISIPTKWNNIIVIFNGIVISFIILTTAFIRWRQRYKPSKYFLLAMFAPLLGIIIRSFSALGFIPYGFYVENRSNFTFSLSVLLFSFALADRINLIQDEREKAQNEALKNAELNQKLIQEQNIILEKKLKKEQNNYPLLKKKRK
ncbi:7TM diverse intracellular signaling domain-containing protein [Okeania sp. KiyG1]|uniref:7TMR-DISM family protein n=1 Tax=Okeania sp. KiyG1 TaxID=2720165 RepID=UPI001F2AC6C1|nr:7TM diverse intracellular signaling domain-containing protein [Okeania sp. KiyG1]